ncbi:hypothetical protein A33Q_0448 [Indibacter alkaliphilus LW1]|uniref:Uncharacterized protein n=1 Tax=Indibacter alkaliphilus (strain CCUG 57479 / KCTC 22604 / LW1) TaxID=1189612 RepID=S2DLD1_INDAL|nr:hypothetical protein [Indibacter alkaliphilus]EOZ99767.1 hypothetical protein A33Q_0448 [Indibacter alkaliphilus LW1]
MNNFKKSIPLLFILAYFTINSTAEAQLISKYDNLQGFTKTEDIIILDDFSQVDGLIKIGEAYSKARGVTMFSSMNSLNVRAKRKLLEEATVRGASHVLITHKIPDDGVGLTSIFMGRLFSYQAIFYKSEDKILSEENIKPIIEGKRFVNSQNMTTNRNTFGANHSKMASGKLLTIDANAEIVSKNKKVYIEFKTRKPTGILVSNTFEVIGANENFILLFEELTAEKKYRALLMKRENKKGGN